MLQTIQKFGLFRDFPDECRDVSVTPVRDLDEGEINSVFERPVYQEIIGSEAFQRLKEIRFLGAIDYVINLSGVPPKKRHTRFQHSLRVGQLAIQYSRLCNLSEPKEIHLVVSALVHDIGHAPLSHSLERTFKERFGLSHHSASEMIIRGAVPIGRQLPSIWKKYNINATEILALIDGSSSVAYAYALRNPINIDTVEAITRSYTYISQNLAVSLPNRIVIALVRRNQSDVSILDEFWRLKDTVYNHLITSEIGLLADYVCQEYMKEHLNLWKGTYFHTETELRKRHSELFDRLRKIKSAHPSTFLGHGLKIPYQRRRFVIDESVRLRTYEDMYRRYKHTREDAELQLAP
jgi:hypothetical protein